MSDLISRKALLEVVYNNVVPDKESNWTFTKPIIDAITNAPAIEQGEVVGYIDEFGNFENSLKQWMVEERDVKWKVLYTSPKQIPDGWKLVPIDITEDMHVAAVKAIQKCTGNDDFPRTVYKAMLNAAPTASETNTEVGE